MFRSLPLYILIFVSIVFYAYSDFTNPKSIRLNSRSSFISDSSQNSMRWRLVGPFRAGRALAAEGIPGQPSTFYFGSVDGGVWKSANAGRTWEPISDGQMNPSIGAIAISSSNPKIIYVGTGEADMRSDITYGEGVYKSIDGGKHWTHLGLEDTRHIGKILIDPQNPNIVLAAALGHAYAPNEKRGVFRTTDGGKSWKKVLFKNDSTGAIDLSWDNKFPEIVYASLWNAQRTPWSQYPPDEGIGSGIYKSTDEGATWEKVNSSDLPSDTLGRIGISVVQNSHGKKIYALIQAMHNGSGLYYSDDGGAHWQLRSTNPQIVTRMWYFGRVFVDPMNSDIVYVPNRSLFRSIDGGKTFTAIKGSPGGDDYHYLWIDPENDNHLIVASDQGTVVSSDDGKTWSSWYNQPTAQFYHVATDNQFPYRIYGAQQDAGTVSITSRSDYGQITFRDWYSINGGESGYIAPDPTNPNIIYGGNTYGGLSRFDRTTGQTQNISPWLLSSFGQSITKRKFRFTWTSPICFDPQNKESLYYGAQKLLRTDDGGLHWKSVSPDLTISGLENKSGLTSNESSHIGWGVIYSIAVSPVKSGIIWIGTDDGLIQLTKDNGKHWQNVTPNNLSPWSKISIIEASPFKQNIAYAAVDRHRLNDFAPYIYKTIDFGKTWTRIDKGIPGNSFVRVVRADPLKKGLLYAGTETGVYVSFNDGNNWQPLQLNMPTVSIRDLAIHENDLVAATHGRAFWVLDDLTALRQINKEVLNSNSYLFKREDAIRIRRSENHDTPLPQETPHGDNPPGGAIIDYYLNSTIESPLSLKIFDGKGNLVRKYSSEDKPEPPSQQPYFMTYWLPKFKPLTTHKGLNRFVWDLRYSPPFTKSYHYGMTAIIGKGTVREPQGPLALPGNYKIVLTVNGKSYSQTLKLKMDSRVKVSNKALNDQLILALEIWNASSDEFQIGNEIDSVNNQLKELKNIKTNSSVISEVNKISQIIGKINHSLYSIGIANLEYPVLSADREPTEPMKEAYKILSSKLSEVKKDWKEVKSISIKKLNSLLIKNNLNSIKIPEVNPEHYKIQ